MRAVSLMYHDVVERGQSDSSGFAGADASLYKLAPPEFEAHLNAIAAELKGKPGCILDYPLDHGADTPLFITFDDGGISAYTHISDALEKIGWRGHFFITTDYVGCSSFMSNAHIRELRARGHLIGSHSSSHPIRMSHCSWQQMVNEWGSSVAALSDILGESIKVASLPGGHYSKRVAEAAALQGIEFLFTSEPTIKCSIVEGCLVLGRYSVQRWTSPKTAASIACARFLPRFKQTLFWNVKKVAKAAGGRGYLRSRESLLSAGR